MTVRAKKSAAPSARLRRATGTGGRVLLSVVALSAPVGAFAADWNETHVYNPNWPPHAKFHNGQTISAAIELAALSLWQLWGPGRRTRSSLRWGTLLAGLYYATQAPAGLFPGAAPFDPEFADRIPTVAGRKVNQAVGIVVLAPILAVGYRLASAGRTSA